MSAKNGTKEELLKEMREDFISYVEEFIKIKDKDGNLVEFKLNRFQKMVLDSILTKHLMNFQAVTSARVKRGYKL